MNRRSLQPGSTSKPAIAVLLGALLLGGCASQARLPENQDLRPAEAYTQLGVAYLERNNLTRAMDALDHALSLAPNDPEALQAMALVYQRQGESRLADESFRQALAADRDFTRARNNYAAFLYAQGRLREACEQLEQAALDPQYPNRAQLFANLGQCQLELGDAGAARQSLARAQSLDPRYPRSYYLLARLEHARGNHARAEQQLEMYVRLAGADADTQTLAREIDRAQGGHADPLEGPDAP